MSFQLILQFELHGLDFKSPHFDPVLGFASDFAADLKSSPVLIVGFEILLQRLSEIIVPPPPPPQVPVTFSDSISQFPSARARTGRQKRRCISQ